MSAAEDVDERGELREARRAGFILTGVLALVAVVSYALGHPGRAGVAGGLAGVVALLAGFVPGVWRIVHRLWMKAATAIGRFLSLLALCAAFYGVMTPAGVLRRLFGTPRFDAAWHDGRASNWKDKPPEPNTLERYRKQH